MLHDPRLTVWIIIWLGIMFFAMIISAWDYFSNDRRNRIGLNFHPGEMIVGILVMYGLSALMYSEGIRIRQISGKPEQIGGFITAKYFKDGDHQRSYDCNCSTDKDGVRHCSTCYETVYHRDFFLENSTGDWWSGNKWEERNDKPCKNCEPYNIPDAWEISYVGMPISLDHTYKDYVTAIWSKDFTQVKKALANLPPICPDYPRKRVNEFKATKIFFSKDFTDLQKMPLWSWNFSLQEKKTPEQIKSMTVDDLLNNSDRLYMDEIFAFGGSHYQNDTNLIFMNTENREYADLCMANWNHGAKNALYIFVFGKFADGEFRPSSAKVIVAMPGEEKNKDIKNSDGKSNAVLTMKLEEDLQKYFSGGELDRVDFLSIVLKNVDKYWNRSEMANFKSMAKLILPTDKFIVIMVVTLTIACVLSVGFFTAVNVSDIVEA
jgi:hypothetical protein